MSRAPVLHQETRLSPSPSLPSQILHINTSPEQQSSTFGAGRKRGFDEISGLDEESYARKYLATEGSVFFRRKSRAPRSFLWRVLEDRKVLEIQSVDLVHDKGVASSESWLTFRIGLNDEIVRNGVAFADPDATDALDAFVLTAGNEIYTFTLKRDLLTRETVPHDFDATTCFRRYSSNSLAFRHPYRMVAPSSLELLISLHDGGLMRLQRQANESGAQWRETFFSEGGWSGTLRGLIPLKRHQTVRCGNLELEPNTIAAMAKSPEGKYIWTVGLDHELKAWSTETGKTIARMDMLREREDEDWKKQPKYLMGAEQGTLLQVVTLPPARKSRAVARMDEDGKYYLVLHSPKDHQFKIYEASSTFTSVEGEAMRLDDMQPGGRLIPPIEDLLNTNIWHLEEFFVQPGPEWQEMQIWLRARSGTLCRTFTLTFSLFDKNGEVTDIEDIWQTGWTVVDPGMQTTEAIKECVDFPGDLDTVSDTATAPSEKWLDFVFCPGRFSTASVESALHRYRKGRGLSASSGGGKGLNSPVPPLKERLTQAITSKIILRRLFSEQPDYDRYQAEVQAQWNMFFSLLSHLHTRRHDSIGLAFDPEDALAWSICADFVAPIRTTSYFESLCLNQHLLQEDGTQGLDEGIVKQIFPDETEAEPLCQLIGVATGFCARLSADFKEKLKNAATVEALEHDAGDRERNVKRVHALYESNNINAEVMDDDFLALESSAEILGGLGNLDESAILGILELMTEDTDSMSKDQKALNRYGDKLMVTVAQETLERDRATLLDLLTLVVFMYGDLDQEDLHRDFVAQIGPIYDAIIVRIKHNAMLSWLAGNEISEPRKQHRSSKSSQLLEKDLSTINLLERIAIGDFDPKSRGGESMPELLTMWSKQWTSNPDLYGEWDGITGYILGVLIKEEHYGLATEFQKFLSSEENSSSWIKYLEGRLALATGDYVVASLKFRAAAVDMAEATRIASADDASLLDEEERNHFGNGQPHFYQHVSALFEKLKVLSYTADFAQLALQQLENDPEYESTMAEIDRRTFTPDSPDLVRAGSGVDGASIMRRMEQTKGELLGRLFNALVQTGRFSDAFAALVKIDELPIKKANLKELIEKCVKQDAVPELLALPFEEGRLAQEADAVLLALAKKGLASGSAGSPPYYQFLYAFRTQRSDFRGAAGILHEHLERLRYMRKVHGLQDPEDETLIQAYILLINTLACCGQENAWLLADPIDGVHGIGTKRRLVTIDDVRKEYGAELDWRSDLLQGRFPLVGGGEEMDVL